MANKLGVDFFQQDVHTLAKELLGKELNFYNYKALICETESYDESDPSSHCYLGKQTKRNFPMFLEGGTIYVYFIYGKYYCLNLVAGIKGVGAAVLIRSIYIPAIKTYINGPGKLCKYLNINREYNGLSVINNPLIFISDIHKKYPFDITPRIGISKGKELLQRYVIKKETIIKD